MSYCGNGPFHFLQHGSAFFAACLEEAPKSKSDREVMKCTKVFGALAALVNAFLH